MAQAGVIGAGKENVLIRTGAGSVTLLHDRGGALGAQAPEPGISDKLLAGPLNQFENWRALERPSARIGIQLSFDPAANPYPGLRLSYGGWPERPGPKQACVAMEPSTAPVDSLAETGSWPRVRAPGESSTWNMRVSLDQI